MPNFYITKDMISGSKACITGEEAHHISRVLRMKKGDAVTLCDGEGTFYESVLTDFSQDGVTAEIKNSRIAETEPKVKITLYQAIPKSPKLEMIVQKLTELGVTRIVPMNTARIVAKLDKENKIERLRKIVIEAAKQSKRGIIPKVESPVDFGKAAADAAKAELSLIPYEEETQNSLRSEVSESTAKTLSIMIGPEGGFEKSEIELAKSLGIIPVTLGKRILRTETAGIAVVSAALCMLGEME